LAELGHERDNPWTSCGAPHHIFMVSIPAAMVSQAGLPRPSAAPAGEGAILINIQRSGVVYIGEAPRAGQRTRDLAA
jgi:hypothetical protein